MNRRWLFAVATACVVSFAPFVRDAHAADPASTVATSDAGAPATLVSPVPQTERAGLAVLAIGNAGAPAWTLAQSIYGNALLRPSSGERGGLDEAHARVLAGEAAPVSAAPDLKDLADTRSAVRGDDAPSRALLASIANTFHVRGIVVVEMTAATHPSARVFVVSAGDVGAFDAARYEPDASAPTAQAALATDAGVVSAPTSGATSGVTWNGAAASLARAFATPATVTSSPSSATTAAPALATSAVPDAPRDADEGKKASTPFYKSPWFWGAVGAAAFGTTAIYFATRDNSSGTIHLELQAPK